MKGEQHTYLLCVEISVTHSLVNFKYYIASTKTNSMKFLFIILLIPACFCHAQDKPETGVTNVTKLTFLNPGISYEARVGKLQTAYVQAFMNTSAYFSYSSSIGSSSGVYFDPAATAQYRYYYNAAARQAKGKRTEMNSMNYIAGLAETIFTRSAADDNNLKEVDRRPVTTF